ncbi:TOBE domain-containing protein [Helicobacter sp. MIT 05-5294]|uniref:TOBE domain-containing protein n=1 Tax=Helicobacter sp. MIT 05-5294 TaxID=1548150 RepID=UPI0010FD0350|nr:TOBE domain-containing protein [Helicobacter sp. MIT 05-5294]TLD88164.1 LysR family transcriptional regulator [Helicobacter sp. MIT 05-5294]
MQVQGRLWIKEQDKNFLGTGKVELLERIAQSGSISKAAKEMKMSYKAAWDSIDLMNKITKEPLVVRVTGGKGGGGTQITQKGLEAIRIFREMERVQKELFMLFEGNLNEWDSVMDYSKWKQCVKRRFMIKTSARNQLFGEIVSIKEGKVNAEIVLQINKTTQITSTITLHSLKELGLKVGMEAYALIKANWIVVFTEEPKGISLKNCIGGVVKNIVEGAVNCEVEMESDKTIFSAVITEDSKENLALKVGQKVWFGFKANNVILGI